MRKRENTVEKEVKYIRMYFLIISFLNADDINVCIRIYEFTLSHDSLLLTSTH